MTLTLIAAIDRCNAIGYEGKLLFWLPDDLKRFKALTTGHTIVMGRRTFESFPNGALPNRRNVVLTSRADAHYAGAECYSSLDAALASCDSDEQVYIIGGESVYEQAMELADYIELTEIDAEAPEADAWFPIIDLMEWSEESREDHPADDRHPYAYSFVTYTHW
ncbi:MAG: dihydrofolate reductase [Prevotellaceae bacterium]|jgi:dihydrofolate reductase|nr:dihydrofolate reductase [Prevotellaceae bacterium]